MPIAKPSRPELIVAGTVVAARNITRANDRTEVIGAEYTLEAPNGDRLGVTCWAGDRTGVDLGAGEAAALVVTPTAGRNGDNLVVVRRLTPGDLDHVGSFAGFVSAKA